VILCVRGTDVALDQTCFYPGGGGQPADRGILSTEETSVTVNDVKADPDGILWHCCEWADPGWEQKTAQLSLDLPRRSALSRYHTVLHLVNTIALRDYGAWITGAQIDVEYARIDFKWDGFSPSLCNDVEAKVNREIGSSRSIRAYSITEAEFNARPELLRTLKVRPPVFDGRVRIVEIAGFDAQACGGTHIENTTLIGRMSVERVENKGSINKRLYVKLNSKQN
jgi:misacylated tRNA(Ala) deacylase